MAEIDLNHTEHANDVVMAQDVVTETCCCCGARCAGDNAIAISLEPTHYQSFQKLLKNGQKAKNERGFTFIFQQ